MEEGWEEMREHLRDYIVDLGDFTQINTIGKGAFGKVYLANNNKTNIKYAIKELQFEHLEGRQLKLFCREVQILAKCHNLFLLPFRGFTLSFPYSIVTEFITNGSLYEALRHKPKAPSLSPTHKTIIALGIANGMCHLHELNIIHRDLKSLNILLDENYYPKICDFGIARFKAESNQPVTQQIGTPHWMAPELFLKNNYDSKVDVYAYAIILWEMITEKIPFCGMNPIQIMTLVCQNHERPPLPEDLSPNLASLINLCWAQSPQERPTFKNIYKLFKEKKVYFDGTDFDEVDHVIEKIEEAELAQRLSKGTPLPSVDDAWPALFEISDKEKYPDGGLSILNNYTASPSFKIILDNVLSSVDENNVNEFYNTIEKTLDKVDDDHMTLVLNSLKTVISKSEKFLNLFIKSNAFNNLPFSNSSCFPILYDLIGGILQISPSAVKLEQMQALYKANYSKYPSQVVTLFYLVSKDFDETYAANTIFEFLLQHSTKIVKYNGPLLLQMINELATDHNDLFERYFDQMRNILLVSFSEANKLTVAYAYRIAVKFFDEELIPPQITSHLKDPCLVHDAVVLLNKFKAFKLTENIISILLSNIHHRTVFEYIIKIAPNYAEILFSLSNLWISNQDFQLSNALRLLVVIVDNKKVSPSDEQTKEILNLFMEVMKSSNPFLSTIAHIIKKLDMNKSAKQIFERSKFISKLTDNVIKKPSEEFVHSSLVLMNLFTPSYISNDFLRLLPKVQDKIESNPTLIYLSMIIVLKIGSTEETRKQINQIGFIKSFIHNSLSSQANQFGNLFAAVEAF